MAHKALCLQKVKHNLCDPCGRKTGFIYHKAHKGFTENTRLSEYNEHNGQRVVWQSTQGCMLQLAHFALCP